MTTKADLLRQLGWDDQLIAAMTEASDLVESVAVKTPSLDGAFSGVVTASGSSIDLTRVYNASIWPDLGQ